MTLADSTMETTLRKGFDEVLECLSIIQTQVPNVRYLIIGDGEDRERLERALELGVADVVRFIRTYRKRINRVISDWAMCL